MNTLTKGTDREQTNKQKKKKKRRSKIGANLSSKRLLNRIQFGKLHGIRKLCKQHHIQNDKMGVYIEMLLTNIQIHTQIHRRARAMFAANMISVSESRAPMCI